MKTLHYVVLLAAAVATIAADERFRSDYEYHSHAQGWFKLHKTPSTWSLADLQCYFEGGVLASPLDEYLKDAMMSIIRHNKHAQEFGVHTGISNRFNYGQYNSIEGVPLSDMPVEYNGVFSDEYGLAENCMRMHVQGELIAANCSDALPYICYKNYTEDLKQTECGTTDKGYEFNKRTGSCYKFHNHALDWWFAYMACAAEGGHLAIINSDAEAQALKELFAKYPSATIKGAVFNDGAHIGFLNWYRRGVWRTIFGQSLQSAGYAKWGGNEPNNQSFKGHQQYCGSMFRSGLLDDTYCDMALAFICEKDPESLRG